MNGTRRARQERLWSVAEQPLLTEPLPQATAATVHDNFCKVGLGKGTIILYTYLYIISTFMMLRNPNQHIQ